MPICEEIEVRMVKIINDGLRGPKTITWSLFSYTPDNNPTHKAELIAFLLQASVDKSHNITFPPRYLTEASEYVFQLESSSWFGKSFTQVFTIQTAYAEKIELEVQPTGKLVTPRSKDFTAKVLFRHFKCLTATSVEQVYDQLSFKWTQKSGSPDLGLSTSGYQLTAAGSTFTEITLPKFTGDALESYTFEYYAGMTSKPINNTIELTISVSQAALKAQIIGSSRIASFQQPFDINCTAQDPDIPEDDPTPYKDMLFTWTC